MEAAIRLQGVSWIRHSRRVLDSVDVSIAAGRVHVLLGPNGSGKTSMLRVVLGLARGVEGCVRVLGGHPNDLAVRKRCGALLEHPALIPHLSAGSHLAAVLEFLGRPTSLVAAALQAVGLPDDPQPVREFSLGMRQRIGLALALVADPMLLVLDEPLNGLDPESLREMRELIRGAAANGRTVLVSTHQLDEAARLADDVTVLRGGRVRFTGTLTEFQALARGASLEDAYFTLS